MEIWLNRVFRVLKFLLNIVNRVRFIVFFFFYRGVFHESRYMQLQ